MRKSQIPVLLLLLFVITSSAAFAQENTVTLKFAYWGDQEYHEAIVGALDAFQKEYPAIKVEPVYVAGGVSFSDAILTMIAGGVAPDVMDMSVGLYPLLEKNQSLLDLGELIDKDPSLDRNSWLPGVLEMFGDGEKVYALPRSPNMQVLWYNANAFDEAGIARPGSDMTWDGYVDAARRLTLRRGDSVVRWGASPYSWTSAVFQNGGEIVGEDGLALGSSAAVEALQWTANHALEYRFAPTPAMNVSATRFMDGHFAMSVQGSWRLAAHLNIDGFEWGATGLPSGIRPAAEGSIDMGVVSAATQHPNEAWLLLKYLNVKGESVSSIFGAAGKLKPPLTRNPGVHGEIWAAEPRSDVKRVITSQAQHIVDPFHGLVKAAEIRSAINPVIREVMDGLTSVEAAVESLEPVINGMLR